MSHDDDPQRGDRLSANASTEHGRVANPESGEEEDEATLIQRRRVLQAAIGVGAVLAVGGLSALSVTTSLRPPPETSPDREPPADGDALVLAEEQERGLTPDDVPLASGLILAYPRDPASGVVKAGTVNNLMVLTRFDPDELNEATRARAADGIVANSGVCTHLGCTVTTWEQDRRALHCVCHHAYFDPTEGADVIAGPAPRALPGIPLKIVAGALLVAGGFLGPVGPE